MTPEILYKSKNAIVIYKPPVIPSQSDSTGSADALSLTKDILRSHGEREDLYLINRLDRVVGGLMVFARNKEYAKKMSDVLSKDSFTKKYFAIADGSLDSGEMIDWIAKDGVTNKAIINDNSEGSKLAVLSYECIDTVVIKGKEKSLYNVNLKTGRFHQIRAQFAHRGSPLIGDKKYGSRDFLTRQPALFSYNVSIDLGDEKIQASKLPDVTKYPWNLFSAEKYKSKIGEQ